MILRHMMTAATAAILGTVLLAGGATLAGAQSAPTGLNAPVDANRPIDKASDRSGEFEPWQSSAQQPSGGAPYITPAVRTVTTSTSAEKPAGTMKLRSLSSNTQQ